MRPPEVCTGSLGSEAAGAVLELHQIQFSAASGPSSKPRQGAVIRWLPLIYGTLVLLFLWLHKLRIRQQARFGNPFGLQTSLVFMGSFCNGPSSLPILGALSPLLPEVVEAQGGGLAAALLPDGGGHQHDGGLCGPVEDVKADLMFGARLGRRDKKKGAPRSA